MEFSKKSLALKRVVVTGIGLFTPVGKSKDENWQNLIQGNGGIGMITHFDTTNFPVKIAAEVKGYVPENYFDRKDLRKYDPYIQFALIASDEAVKDSGLALDKVDLTRIGVYIGSGIGGIQTIEYYKEILMQKGPDRVSPFFLPATIANLASGQVSIRFGFRGPNMANCTACATGTHAIGDSFKIIQRGDADVMIAGGSEYPITPLGIAGFSVMRALSTRNDDPARASRPFDKNRDGFVTSEGSALLILESLEHAVKRGARIYAEVTGYGMSGDGFHMTAPDPEADGALRSMRAAIRDAGLEPQQIQYINAHGTSTPLNDKLETLAIKKLFGEHARKLAISSTKSMTGHMLGATGSAEAAYTTLAIANSKVPPTINYEVPDEECDLNYTPNKAIELEIENGLSNSFGFGGTNGTLIISKFRE